MKFRQLQTFVAIVDNGGVARAAARLNLTQSAASRAGDPQGRRFHVRFGPAQHLTLLEVWDNAEEYQAFGLAHMANAAALELGFVLSQATFASVVGVACAYLMARTRSVYPAMVLHALVNGVVVFM